MTTRKTSSNTTANKLSAQAKKAMETTDDVATEVVVANEAASQAEAVVVQAADEPVMRFVTRRCWPD